MTQIVFGSYLPGNSFVHKLNPTLKIIATLLLITWSLLARNTYSYLVLIIFISLEILIAKIPFKTLFKLTKPFLFLILFTVIIQFVFGNGGHVIWNYGPFKITSVSIQNSFVVFIRFMLIIIEAVVLTVTTSPNEIANGVERLIKPLQYIGVPIVTIGIMLSIALQFVPTLLTELQTIMDSQRSRGVVFNKGGLIKRSKNICSLIIPLLVSSFRHADHLADALSVSGFDASKQRSSYFKNSWSKNDTFCLLIVLLLGLLILCLRSIN